MWEADSTVVIHDDLQVRADEQLAAGAPPLTGAERGLVRVQTLLQIRLQRVSKI